jgi:hypothetical protein
VLDKQLMQFNQGRDRHPRRPQLHPGASGGVEHPGRYDQDVAGKPPQHEQLHRPRAARRIVVGLGAHTARASDNGPQLLARDRQNDRAIALTRKNSLFAGSNEGAENWAMLASLIETCKLNGVNPEAYFADVLTRLVNNWPNRRLGELLPWRWTSEPS